LRVDWSIGTKLFIGAARNGALSKEADVAADLGTCVRLIRDWPPDIALLPEPGRPR
jgi:hypothetical protein